MNYINPVIYSQYTNHSTVIERIDILNHQNFIITKIYRIVSLWVQIIVIIIIHIFCTCLVFVDMFLVNILNYFSSDIDRLFLWSSD